jgi:hypothetical protein
VAIYNLGYIFYIINVSYIKMKEGNYIFIIGILIAACIGLYNGMNLSLGNIFWIFIVGLMIYGAIATLTNKW